MTDKLDFSGFGEAESSPDAWAEKPAQKPRGRRENGKRSQANRRKVRVNVSLAPTLGLAQQPKQFGRLGHSARQQSIDTEYLGCKPQRDQYAQRQKSQAKGQLPPGQLASTTGSPPAP